MITVKEAYSALPESLQSLVIKAFKYDDSAYLFIAPENDDDDSDPFYLVTDNKTIFMLNPFDDLDNFNKAIESEELEWN